MTYETFLVLMVLDILALDFTLIFYLISDKVSKIRM